MIGDTEIARYVNIVPDVAIQVKQYVPSFYGAYIAKRHKRLNNRLNKRRKRS